MERLKLSIVFGAALLLGAICASPLAANDAGHRTRPLPDPRYPRAPPDYSPASIRLAEEGATVLTFAVLPDGSTDPASVEIVQSSGFSRLDDAARQVVPTWRYRPAMENGRPVKARLSATLVFEMTRRPPPDHMWMRLMASDPRMVSVEKKFAPRSDVGRDEDGHKYQEGVADMVHYRIQGNGLALFQTDAFGIDGGEAWSVKCGSFGAEKACVAEYLKLQVALREAKGWLVSIIGHRMSDCPIAFIAPGPDQRPDAFRVESPPDGPALFEDKDGTGIIRRLMDMDSFATPCADAAGQPNMAMKPPPFLVVRRYMEWVLAGQPRT